MFDGPRLQHLLPALSTCFQFSPRPWIGFLDLLKKYDPNGNYLKDEDHPPFTQRINYLEKCDIDWAQYRYLFPISAISFGGVPFHSKELP